MRGPIVKLTLAALCLAPAAIAWTSAANQPLVLQPQSRLWVDGKSNVRSFTCNAKTIEAQVDATAPGAVSAVMDGHKAVRSATLTVAADALDCRNGTMNEHMRKALKTKEFPTVTFRVATYDLSQPGADTLGAARGELQLGGVTKPITVQGSVRQEADGTLHIVGTYPLRMTEYGIKPPSLMMGTMKVKDQVTVHFDLILKG
jgi:polyisoprenoid-binding protein YceI